MKTNISGLSSGLVAELDKQTDIAISDSTNDETTAKDWFGNNIKTITDDNDYGNVAAAVETANAFYKLAYPNDQAPTTAEERKKIKKQADKDIIDFKKNAAIRRNSETISGINNPSSKK